MITLSAFFALCVLNSFAVSTADLSYYTREQCIASGYLPKWQEAGYEGKTHFEKLFKSPLAIDLIASANSGNATGFEQITADWGCDFASCYGSPCQSEGFYGPGAKDPAGGGCPHGPVKVYEDLTCAIQLGLSSNPNAFSSFCDTTTDEKLGLFECISFFANVLTETGSFAETEERDPRPYCWDRSGSGACCPGETKPCLEDSDKELTSSDYPSDNSLWLGSEDVEGKCCSYHGRGFLQVSYEPNYQALSEALVGDKNLLWHSPHKLDSDGVAGWTAALWFWFNEHPAQIANEENGAVENVSPRSEIYRWQQGRGFPGTINIINGGECNSAMNPQRGLTRTSMLFSIAHRLGATPPTLAGEVALSYYPLPGTPECESSSWCRLQFHNSNSPCPTFNTHVSCVMNMNFPYLVNASTPVGFNRITVKTVQADGQTPICQFGSTSAATPTEWITPQSSLEPIDQWWTMLDINTENVCDIVKLTYPVDENYTSFVEGNTQYCTTVCSNDFAQDTTLHGKECEEPQKPCKALAEYVSHPLPATGWESGDMGGYLGGIYLGRVGPGLVMAMNDAFGDRRDTLCYHFGASACHWNIAMGCAVESENDVHYCRVYPTTVESAVIEATIKPESRTESEILSPGEFPDDINTILEYYDDSNCPTPDGSTILEKILPNGVQDIDYIFSSHYSQSDGFANQRYDSNPDDPTINLANEQYGRGGPEFIWKRFLCAYQLGLPSDPDYFKKNLFLRSPASTVADVPVELTEDEKRFALLEFISMAANMLKETGALSQAEEQDPRCYCNYQGGAENPCCPNEWGNNPPCSVSREQHILTQEEMDRGTGLGAQCCSYHGRGYLQTSYERNYGDLGAMVFTNDKITPDRGRQLLLNFPQAIDSFSTPGFVATFSFWLNPHPCQYCDGRNTTTVDWNAKEYSPHEAIVNYDVTGEGLGKTFSIINGQECEAAFTTEHDVSQTGAADRLSLFYNLAYRLGVKAPGEDTILPLPGTKECDSSNWCKGTFYPTDVPVASYRAHAGGCWALTPQPVGNKEVWPYCSVGEAVHTTKLGAHWTGPSFSLVRQSATECTHRHDFHCGTKAIDPLNKPSMSEVAPTYVAAVKTPSAYSDPNFVKYAKMTPEEICEHVVDTVPGNNLPPSNQDCKWWCLANSGAMSCTAMQGTTCTINNSGISFAACANTFFDTTTTTADCRIDLDGTGNYPTQAPVDIADIGSVDCSGVSDWSSATIYSTAGTKVVHRGYLFSNKYWSSGSEPGSTDSWSLLGTCSSGNSETSEQDSTVAKTLSEECVGVPEWSSSTTYGTPNTAVIYDGKKYQNSWWVTGSAPGVSDAWKLVSNC